MNASYTKSGGSRLTIDASASLSTSFTKMAGFDKIDVAANSEVKWGNTRLRIALVLDTTGSMNSDGKMGAMKTAAKNLLDQLKSAAAGDGDVYASLIPFSKNVNVGASNHNADWIDWTDWESQPAILKNSKPSNWSSIGPGDDCPFTNSSHGFRCTAGPTSTTAVSEIPSSGAYRGYICPSPDSGNKDSSKVGIVYNGCYNSVPVTTTVELGIRCELRLDPELLLLRQGQGQALHGHELPAQLDQECAQHLERLRHRPRRLERPERRLRPEGDGAFRGHAGEPLPRRAERQLLRSGDGR